MSTAEVTGYVDENAQRISEFQRNGFVGLGPLAEPSELERLEGVFEELIASRTGNRSFRDLVAGDATGGDSLPQIIKPEIDVPDLLNTGCVRRAHEWAGALLDVPVADVDYFGHIILKPARAGAPTPWHQDEAYLDPRWSRRTVTIWMPLADASEDNGCLHFVPGSHLTGVLPHRHIGGKDDVEGLEAVEPPAAGTAVPLRAGHATAHDSRTMHYAGANRTGAPRWAYIHVFSTPAVEVDNPESRPWLG